LQLAACDQPTGSWVRGQVSGMGHSRTGADSDSPIDMGGGWEIGAWEAVQASG